MNVYIYSYDLSEYGQGKVLSSGIHVRNVGES